MWKSDCEVQVAEVRTRGKSRVSEGVAWLTKPARPGSECLLPATLRSCGHRVSVPLCMLMKDEAAGTMTLIVERWK